MTEAVCKAMILMFIGFMLGWAHGESVGIRGCASLARTGTVKVELDLGEGPVYETFHICEPQESGS